MANQEKRDVKIEYINLNEIKPYKNNPRVITDKAIVVVKESIKQFGIKQPIVLDKNNVIIAGHTRYKALCQLQEEKYNLIDYKKIPTIIARDLTPKQIKAYRIVDNKSSEYSIWDDDLLKLELKDFDLQWKEDLNLNFDEINYIEESNETQEGHYEDYDDKAELDEVFEKEKAKVETKKTLKCPKCGTKIEI